MISTSIFRLCSEGSDVFLFSPEISQNIAVLDAVFLDPLLLKCIVVISTSFKCLKMARLVLLTGFNSLLNLSLWMSMCSQSFWFLVTMVVICTLSN